MSEVSVWLIRIDDFADVLESRCQSAKKILCPCDLEHIRRQPDEQRRRTARATRAALRLVLREHLGPYAASQPIAHGPHGKPLLPSGIGGFSLAHTERTALIAVCDEGSIGIDLEASRDLSFSDERRAKLLAAARSFAPVALGDDEFGLLQGWTRLEAVAKVRGSGIGQLLAEVGIWGGSHADRSADAVAAASIELALREGVSVHDLDLPPELFGALAVIPALADATFPVRRVTAAQVMGD